MLQLLGEFDCRLDPKGRLMVPSALKKQLPEKSQEKFVINRGFEKCLVLFPWEEWQKESARVNALNLYTKKNREFVRYFYRGATELPMDNTHRILIPKPLLDYAGIDKDLILNAFSNRIEVWSKTVYEALLDQEPPDFSDLAEEVMGGGKPEEKGAENVS
jgi:MraZ protein